MIDKLSHKRENIRVICRCSKNDFSVTESILNTFCHILSCKVIQDNFRASVCFKLLGEQFNRFFRVTVHRGVRDHNAFTLDSVGRPCVIKVQIISEIFGKNRTVQRADRLNIQSRCLFQQCLYLRAVFADDTEIIPSRFASPVFLCIQCTEFSEAVCREQYFIRAVISDDDLRPVHHRCGHKRQCVLAERKCISFTDNDPAVRKIRSEEVFHHCECL